jgi:hypothetical protein
MEHLLRAYPGLKLSSLPSTENRSMIDFGLKGPEDLVTLARKELINWLDDEGKNWDALDQQTTEI